MIQTYCGGSGKAGRMIHFMLPVTSTGPGSPEDQSEIESCGFLDGTKCPGRKKGCVRQLREYLLLSSLGLPSLPNDVARGGGAQSERSWHHVILKRGLFSVLQPCVVGAFWNESVLN